MHSKQVSTVQHKQCLWLCRSTCKCHAAHKGTQTAEWSTYIGCQGTRIACGRLISCQAMPQKSHLVNYWSIACSIMSTNAPDTHHPTTAAADHDVSTYSCLLCRALFNETLNSCPAPTPTPNTLPSFSPAWQHRTGTCQQQWRHSGSRVWPQQSKRHPGMPQKAWWAYIR
jgi:hypothetical protein